MRVYLWDFPGSLTLGNKECLTNCIVASKILDGTSNNFDHFPLIIC